MLYYNRIDVPEVMNVNGTNKLEECDICHC